MYKIFIRKIKTFFTILSKYNQLKKQFRQFNDYEYNKNRGFKISWNDRLLMIGDNTKETAFDAHYTYHPAWAARELAKIKPKRHTDISSILSFPTLLSAFMPVDFYDYRPANITLSNLKIGEVDLKSLPFKDNSIESISCMHTVEHIGLGRYGDNIDPSGDIKSMLELERVLAKDGFLIFVVPIGKPKIIFNAHRIYSYKQIIEQFSHLKLIKFSLIPDSAQETGMIENASEKDANSQTYGCGCFLFKKL